MTFFSGIQQSQTLSCKAFSLNLFQTKFYKLECQPLPFSLKLGKIYLETSESFPRRFGALISWMFEINTLPAKKLIWRLDTLYV